MIDRDHCYVCKMGWMEGERTPVLYNRTGLYMCNGGKELMDSREEKSSEHIQIK